MKKTVLFFLLSFAVLLPALDIDLHKYRVRQGKYEFTKAGEEKMVKIYSLPKVRSCYTRLPLPVLNCPRACSYALERVSMARLIFSMLSSSVAHFL